MDGETTEQLRSRLANTKQRLEQETARKAQLIRDVNEAAARQRLREQIKDIEDEIQSQRTENEYHANFRRLVDADAALRFFHRVEGPNTSPNELKDRSTGECDTSSFVEVIDCSLHVFKTEFEWTIAGMSWLENTLVQSGLERAESDTFMFYGRSFDLLYSTTGILDLCDVGENHPHGENGLVPKGSLVLRHFVGHEKSVAMRYRFLIKDPSGKFVPWGDITNECHTSRDVEWNLVCGPDFQWVRDQAAPSPPIGIFGKSHRELLESTWVKDDALTVKVQIELRLPRDLDDIRAEKVKNKLTIPQPTLQQDLLSLYDRGQRGDVTFVFDGVRIPAHEAILCVRSEVFDRELSCGMRESVCREIHIHDVDASTFKIFLKFLYTDDLARVEEEVNALSDNKAHSATEKCGDILKDHSPLLQLLCISHRYQVTRLQIWCENQLCKCVSVSEVCSVLCQAHLHQASHLEEVCLSFIKSHMTQVVTTPGFAEVAKRWPEVMVKINLFMAGVFQAQLPRRRLQRASAKIASGRDANETNLRVCLLVEIVDLQCLSSECDRKTSE